MLVIKRTVDNSSAATSRPRQRDQIRAPIWRLKANKNGSAKKVWRAGLIKAPRRMVESGYFSLVTITPQRYGNIASKNQFLAFGFISDNRSSLDRFPGAYLAAPRVVNSDPDGILTPPTA